MLKTTFCGFNGFDLLEKVKNPLKYIWNKSEITDLSADIEMTGKKPAVTKSKNTTVIKPEEILAPNETEDVHACIATLKDLTMVKVYGNDDGFLILSSLRVKEPGKFVSACTLKDKTVTVFDNRVYLNDKESLQGETIYSTDAPVICVGGTDDILILAEEKKLKVIRVFPKVSLARELAVDFNVTAVSCGKEHTLLLTSSGTVYSFGGGSRGQLGLGHIENREEPCILEDLAGVKISHVEAGGWHSLAVSELGDLYVWGWNESGQLGLPCRNISTLHPPPERKENYQMVSPTPAPNNGTWFTPVYLENTESGLCHAYIQRVDPVQIQSEPCVLDLGEDVNVVKVACGSRHSAAVTADGQLLTCGWNDYGQLCHQDVYSRDYFQTVDYFLQNKMTVKDVFCGPWSTIILTSQH
ncbi:RCC1 domain-containing protein 1-like [Saccostrea echinata]|uniref:RCC1 domain-containing protein 1-like n=1 Tax=Saccostrea echinata TaxID=191078 RepID=UPI002A8370AB|nr:RCC1 domain-containing protein 1-like [Saccostrea echinata]